MTQYRSIGVRNEINHILHACKSPRETDLAVKLQLRNYKGIKGPFI